MQPAPSRQFVSPLDAKTRDAVARLVALRGELGALAVLRISRHTLARALGGLPIQLGSRVLVESALAALGDTIAPGRTG